MRFCEPSPIDRFFETPAHQRPLLDLDIPVSPGLPERLRRVGGGATRWADLIIGFSLDDARRQRLDLADVHVALEAANLSMQTFFFERGMVDLVDDPDQPQWGYYNGARLIGSLAARGSMLSVFGREPIGLPFSVHYRRQGDEFRPVSAAYAIVPFRAERLHSAEIDIPDNYAYTQEEADKKDRTIPPELRAVSALGNYADLVERELDAGRMVARSTLSSPRFGEIRGRGSV